MSATVNRSTSDDVSAASTAIGENPAATTVASTSPSVARAIVAVPSSPVVAVEGAPQPRTDTFAPATGRASVSVTTRTTNVAAGLDAGRESAPAPSSANGAAATRDAPPAVATTAAFSTSAATGTAAGGEVRGRGGAPRSPPKTQIAAAIAKPAPSVVKRLTRRAMEPFPS